MACGCGDDKIYKEAIGSSSNSKLTGVVVQSGNPEECLDEWIRSISPTNNTITTKHKIQKIPRLLQPTDNFCQKCYEPQVISIGPYHHGKEALKPMEEVKKRLTREYVSNCEGTSVELIYKKIEGLVEEARKCYADDDDKSSLHPFNNREFARMMVLDGCFLLQFIFCSTDDEDKKEGKLKLKNHEIDFIHGDLFLLENQLPFIILKALMSFSRGGEKEGLEKIKEFIKSRSASPPRASWIEKAEILFTSLINCGRSSHVPKAAAYENDDPAHLLELTRREIVNPNALNGQDQGDKNKRTWHSYRSVRELKAAGIIFLPNRSNPYILTDVRYEPFLFLRAVLRLPMMTIDDSTKSLLLNLVAYEMCPDSPNDCGVISYLGLMDSMIDHPDDVKELRQKGILLNFLGSDDQVANLFNKIADNLVPNPSAYAKVKRQIGNHCTSNTKVWTAEFFHIHFTTPWTILAFIGAIVAIALSLIQTYYAIKPCH